MIGKPTKKFEVFLRTFEILSRKFGKLRTFEEVWETAQEARITVEEGYSLSSSTFFEYVWDFPGNFGTSVEL